MSYPILTNTNSKLDTRVKEPSGVVPPPTGPGSSDRFKWLFLKHFQHFFQTLILFFYISIK